MKKHSILSIFFTLCSLDAISTLATPSAKELNPLGVFFLSFHPVIAYGLMTLTPIVLGLSFYKLFNHLQRKDLGLMYLKFFSGLKLLAVINNTIVFIFLNL